MITVANIVGARPQFIKYCPVSLAISRHNQEDNGPVIRDLLIHTGQHYDYLMSRVFFDEFGLREPDYHLDVGSGSHGWQTAEILSRVEDVLNKEQPDLVLVYGDTNSTLGGGLAAAKLHIPVAHVEAGLRSYNKFMPEEINRLLTDQVSALLLCPSKVAVQNLRREGLTAMLNKGELVSLEYFRRDNPDNLRLSQNNPLIVNIGDIMYDVLHYSLKRSNARKPVLNQLGFLPKQYCLLTIHRAENTDLEARLMHLLEFAVDAAQNRPILFPIHPRTQARWKPQVEKFEASIRVIEPLSYFDMVQTLQHSALVMTDSGGLQKEAYWLQVPCITLREETEWVETLESGWNILYRDYPGAHHPAEQASLAYGDGCTAQRIINLITVLGKEA